MWECRFMDVKPGFYFNYKGAMCRKTVSGYRYVHNTDAVLHKQTEHTVFALDDHEPVKLYIEENGLKLVNGRPEKA